MSSTLELSQHTSQTSQHHHAELVPEADRGTGRAVGISKARAVTIVGSVASVNFINTMSSGILTVALPRIAKDLELPLELLLW